MLLKWNYWGSSLASRSCIVFKDLSRLARCFSRRADTCSFLAMESVVLSICSFRLRERGRKNYSCISTFSEFRFLREQPVMTFWNHLPPFHYLWQRNSQIPGCKFSQQRNRFLMITYKPLKMLYAFDEVISLHYFNLNMLNSRTLGGKITVKITFWFGPWLKTMEVRFCHWIKWKRLLPLLSHNYMASI